MQDNPVIIQQWLQSRQDLVISLHQLCQLRPFNQHMQVQDALQEFCQHLIDYLAVGHFVAFEHMPMISLKKTLSAMLPAFLDFNDKYMPAGNLSTLEKDLSKVALDLAWRFDWEDRLIEQRSWVIPQSQSQNVNLLNT